MYQHLDLFTGIGGMTVALTGCSRPVAYCEKKDTAVRVLQNLVKRKLIPKAKIISDIKLVNDEIKNLPKVTLITAGMPCTGFSSCGLKQGFHHVDSGVFKYLIQICASIKPPMVFLENSPNMYDVRRNRDKIEKAFLKLGYSMLHCKVGANHVNLPHRRTRWFALAYKDSLTVCMATSFQGRLQSLASYREPPRTAVNKEAHSIQRYDLLKNSVVPKCANVALKALLQAFINGSRQGLIMFTPQITQKNNFVMTNGSVTIKKCYWPTPHGCYFYGSPVLNARNSGDLPTAVKYEISSGTGVLSMAWVEWLMGYPRAWTKF